MQENVYGYGEVQKSNPINRIPAEDALHIMLEVSNLTKVYKSKGDVEVKALDGVTLGFPNRGMVFLLGKSGSGKSTLLNVCGGLDAPTSGEIIVKGRSSRDFT